VSLPRFDRDRVRTFVALAGERLEGDWLLIGGAAAAAWFSPERVTEDIDMIGMEGTQAQRFALMELAAEALMPIEAVNSAADFFVRRIDDWRDHLEVLHRGSKATIYRPDATLFVLLKLARLSEVDLGDCVALIATGEPIDRERVRRVAAVLAPSDDVALAERRRELIARLDAAG
jgi:hypothetical protein